MESVVKNNDLGQLLAENLNAGADALNVCGVVQGSKVTEAFNALDNILVDKHTLLEERTALNYAVTDRRDFGKVVNNLAVVLDAANEANIPVYGSEEEQVKNGCLASVSIDYIALGEVTGQMGVDVIGGADISTMAVKTISDATPIVNTDVLSALGMTMPEAYANAATVTTAGK